MADDEEKDELDALMESEGLRLKDEDEDDDGFRAKRPRLDVSKYDSDSDTEINGPVQEPEDLQADVAAAIAGANASVNKTTKKLNQLSKREVNYLPFRKKFYVEVPALVELSDEDVKELRLSLENIIVVGKSCPKPVLSWAHCGLTRKIMKTLEKYNYLSPTPIQAQAIPAIMSGRDVIGIAKTGCGKTLSYLLPMFRHILDQKKLERGEGPIGVIITPTRELATQICDDASKFTRALDLRVVAVYGGPNISKQIGMLKTGAEIVVCTPGRMIDILTSNGGSVTNLDRCTFLVLDEADRLFDMGFERQIRSIVDLIRPDRQTVMFSATFPKIMEAHARRILTKPIEIQVGGRSVVCKDVSQHVEIIEEDDKFLRLLPILQQHIKDNQSKAIVFVSKQEKADSLLEDLMQAYDPGCLVLHGGIDKDDRISTFASFKSGDTKVLVATSIAARGLDVKNCVCVVNYDVPNHYEDYVHRCGRTGRAGNKGSAYTFITPDQGQYAVDIIKALELSENPVPSKLQELWDAYQKEAERLGKKVWSSSGFSGRGFQFDEAEAQLVNEKKKYQKKSFGLQNSDDEDEDNTANNGDDGNGSDRELDAATLESEIKNLSGNKVHSVKPVIRKIGGGSDAKQTAAQATMPTNSVQANNNKELSKLELAKLKATMLLNQRRGGIAMSQINSADQLTTTNQPTSTSSQVLTARQLAEQRAQALRAKLNISRPQTMTPDLQSTNLAPIARQSSAAPVVQAPQLAPVVNEKLEMKFEINDYHQQVRRRLTSKETLAKISEHCEVGITVRGKFCQPGDRPLEPKLYLAIEGNSQASVEKAHRELLLVVKDEYTRINSAPATRGRYRLL